MNENLIKIFKFSGWIAFVIVLFMKIDSCNGYKENLDNIKNVNGSLNELVKKNQAEVTRYAKNDVEQKQLILQLNDKQTKMLIENDSLRKYVKRVESRVGFGTQTNFTGVTIPIGNGETVEIRKRDFDKIQKLLRMKSSTTDSLNPLALMCCKELDNLLGKDTTASLLKLPYSFSYKSNKWLTLDGKITKKDIDFSNIAVKDSFTVMTYEKKTGFLKLGRPQEVVKITSQNPYTTIKDVENVVTKPKKHFYQRPSFWSILAFVAGAVAYHKIAP